MLRPIGSGVGSGRRLIADGIEPRQRNGVRFWGGEYGFHPGFSGGLSSQRFATSQRSLPPRSALHIEDLADVICLARSSKPTPQNLTPFQPARGHPRGPRGHRQRHRQWLEEYRLSRTAQSPADSAVGQFQPPHRRWSLPSGRASGNAAGWFATVPVRTSIPRQCLTAPPCLASSRSPSAES